MQYRHIGWYLQSGDQGSLVMVTVIAAYLFNTIEPVAELSLAGRSRLPDMLRAALYPCKRSNMWAQFCPSRSMHTAIQGYRMWPRYFDRVLAGQIIIGFRYLPSPLIYSIAAAGEVAGTASLVST